MSFQVNYFNFKLKLDEFHERVFEFLAFRELERCDFLIHNRQLPFLAV